MSFYDLVCSKEPVSKHIGQRKKQNDACIKVDAAIKHALAELSADRERRAAFLRLLASVRARTSLLKPRLGLGNTNWTAPVFLIHRLKNVATRHSFREKDGHDRSPSTHA